jgi:hypothetical protein
VEPRSQGLEKDGLVIDSAEGLRISQKGRTEYIRLKAERDGKDS